MISLFSVWHGRGREQVRPRRAVADRGQSSGAIARLKRAAKDLPLESPPRALTSLECVFFDRCESLSDGPGAVRGLR